MFGDNININSECYSTMGKFCFNLTNNSGKSIPKLVTLINARKVALWSYYRMLKIRTPLSVMKSMIKYDL